MAMNFKPQFASSNGLIYIISSNLFPSYFQWRKQASMEVVALVKTHPQYTFLIILTICCQRCLFILVLTPFKQHICVNLLIHHEYSFVSYDLNTPHHPLHSQIGPSQVEIFTGVGDAFALVPSPSDLVQSYCNTLTGRSLRCGYGLSSPKVSSHSPPPLSPSFAPTDSWECPCLFRIQLFRHLNTPSDRR